MKHNINNGRFVSHHDNGYNLSSDSILHIVAVCSNPAMWETRLRLAKQFINECQFYSNVKLHVVELTYGDRPSQLDQSHFGSYLHCKTNSNIWMKEALINAGVRYLLPTNWKYVAWVDMDISFSNKSWALEALNALQMHPIVQPWSNCLDMSSEGNVMQTHSSMGYLQSVGVPVEKAASPDNYYGKPLKTKSGAIAPYPHPGFAWAATRPAYEATKGLMDHCIIGSGDFHQAYSYLGVVSKTFGSYLTDSYKQLCKQWENRILSHTHGYIGYCNGVIKHHFHGKKSDRQYNTRWKILAEHKFSPDRDLTYDHQGLPLLCGKPHLDQAIHRYNVSRNED